MRRSDPRKLQVVLPEGLHEKIESKAESLELRYYDFVRLILALAVRGEFDFVAQGLNREQTTTT